MCWHPPHSLSATSQARSTLIPCGKTQKAQPVLPLCFVQIHRFVGLKAWKINRINHKQCYYCTTVLTKLNLVIARYWSDWSNLSQLKGIYIIYSNYSVFLSAKGISELPEGPSEQAELSDNFPVTSVKPGFCVLGEHVYIYVFISEGSPLSVPRGAAGQGIGSLSPHPTLHNLAPSAPQL